MKSLTKTLCMAALWCGLIPAVSAAEITTNITLVGALDPFTGTNRYGDVWGEGNLAILGSWQFANRPSSHSGVGIIDISIPTAPRLVSVYSPPEDPFRLEDCQIRNRIGFFASGPPRTNGLHIVSLTNPAAPILLSKITSAHNGHNSIHNLFVHGDHLYEADATTPVVKVFNIANIAAPRFVRDILTTDTHMIHDMTVVGNRLYTSGMGGRTDIYDVTDIDSQPPILLGVVLTGVASHSSWATADNRIMATCAEFESRDVRLYDVSDPANPILRSSLNSASVGLDASGPHNPVIVGDLLFVSWYQAGLQAFDIRDPANPVRLGAYDTFPGGMSAANNSCTVDPVCLHGTLCFPGTCFGGNWGIYPLAFDKVLLSDMESGLVILDASAAIPSNMPPFLILEHVTLFEPDLGTTNAHFRVRLSRPTDAIVSVDFTSANGSAEAGPDYEEMAGTLVFNPGETDRTISVVVNGNADDEPDEYFTIHFTNPTNLMLTARQQAVCTIVDNVQPPPAFTSQAFSPTSAYSGAVVTLNGTNFTWATRVLFNGVSAEFSHAPDLEYDRRLTAILPANATSGPITIETAFGNVTSTASFTALVPPQMTIRAFPSNVVELSWPSISGFGLQRADSLTATTVWATASTLSARLSNGVRYVTVTNAVPNRFFRLYRP